MELTQDGIQVRGCYAFRGTSMLDGEISSRRLNFRFHSVRDGPGWFDLTLDAKSFAGAGNADGLASWFGWKGRPTLRFKPIYPEHGDLDQGAACAKDTNASTSHDARTNASTRP
jgi:hypothetical protein